MPHERNIVCLILGQDGSPTSTKMRLLATVAESCGFETVVIDHRHIPNPDDRVSHILSQSLRPSDRLVLAGSSMGGYVATLASQILKPDGLFLLAPAFCQTGYADQNPQPDSARITVVHGWQDEQIPVDNSIRFARNNRAELHLVDGDHRLKSHLDMIALLLRNMLTSISSNSDNIV